MAVWQVVDPGAHPPRTWGDSRARWQPWLSTAVRFVLAGAALTAGASRMADLPGSVRAVRAYDMLPEVLVVPVAHSLPMVEVVLGVLLLLGLVTRSAATLFGLVQLVLGVAIIQAWARGLVIDVDGVVVHTARGEHVAPLLRTAAFGLGAFFLGVRPWSRASLDRTLGIDPLR